MMKVTVWISDKDYDDMVKHLAKDKPGKPLVAVEKVDKDDTDTVDDVDDWKGYFEGKHS